MSLTNGQRVTVLVACQSKPPALKSKYLEGHAYTVTDQNRAMFEEMVTAGTAQIGSLEPAKGPTATMSGNAEVKG
jgi:hypothetical protein